MRRRTALSDGRGCDSGCDRSGPGHRLAPANQAPLDRLVGVCRRRFPGRFRLDDPHLLRLRSHLPVRGGSGGHAAGHSVESVRPGVLLVPDHPGCLPDRPVGLPAGAGQHLPGYLCPDRCGSLYRGADRSGFPHQQGGQEWRQAGQSSGVDCRRGSHAHLCGLRPVRRGAGHRPVQQHHRLLRHVGLGHSGLCPGGVLHGQAALIDPQPPFGHSEGGLFCSLASRQRDPLSAALQRSMSRKASRFSWEETALPP